MIDGTPTWTAHYSTMDAISAADAAPLLDLRWGDYGFVRNTEWDMVDEAGSDDAG